MRGGRRLLEALLQEIYGGGTAASSSASEDSSCSSWGPWAAAQEPGGLRSQVAALKAQVSAVGQQLARQLRLRDSLRRRRELRCDVVSAILRATAASKGEEARVRFSVAPPASDSGFAQWRDAMRMVAKLPGGIPPEFRRRLWLTLAERHLAARGVDWPITERALFSDTSNPDDDELGVQIVKDLHRTGCSLFCGASGEHNQALLKRVLVAYARWNKNVGYCQGFNMLGALILQVMDSSEADSVKVMILLIEGVLPEGYFANNLRGLSVDMAVFRELLRMRLPRLSSHLEALQAEASGAGYEPPLTNVFTMQWFLTLFANCLPQNTVFRLWDLVFLEGNEVLLRAALAIWSSLQERILSVDSADEFYSIMGVLTREMVEFGLSDANQLVIAVVAVEPVAELSELRDRFTYNITPWAGAVGAARRGLRLLQSDDDTDEDLDEDKMAVTAAFGLSSVLGGRRASVDRERLNLDISALKQQYSRLRERQRQAHIIISAACARPTVSSRTAPVVMNHLLLGRSALKAAPRRPSAPIVTQLHTPQQTTSGATVRWHELRTGRSPSPPDRSSSSTSTASSDTELCDSDGSDDTASEKPAEPPAELSPEDSPFRPMPVSPVPPPVPPVLSPVQESSPLSESLFLLDIPNVPDSLIDVMENSSTVPEIASSTAPEDSSPKSETVDAPQGDDALVVSVAGSSCLADTSLTSEDQHPVETLAPTAVTFQSSSPVLDNSNVLDDLLVADISSGSDSSPAHYSSTIVDRQSPVLNSPTEDNSHVPEQECSNVPEDLLQLDDAPCPPVPNNLLSVESVCTQMDSPAVEENVIVVETIHILNEFEQPQNSLFESTQEDLSPIDDSPFELMPLSPVPPPIPPVLTPNPDSSPVQESPPVLNYSPNLVVTDNLVVLDSLFVPDSSPVLEPSSSLSSLQVSSVDIRVSPDISDTQPAQVSPAEHRSTDSSEISFPLQPASPDRGAPSDIGSVHLDTDLSDLDAFLARPIQISCPVSPARTPSDPEEKCPISPARTLSDPEEKCPVSPARTLSDPEVKCPAASERELRLNVPNLVQSLPTLAPGGLMSMAPASPSDLAWPDLAPVTPPRAVSPLSPLARCGEQEGDEATERRARALQVIQENSEILQRIVQQPPPGASWGRTDERSFSPFPRPRPPNREAGLRLGLYRKD